LEQAFDLNRGNGDLSQGQLSQELDIHT